MQGGGYGFVGDFDLALGRFEVLAEELVGEAEEGLVELEGGVWVEFGGGL